MAKIPTWIDPELANVVLKARQIQLATDDDSQAIEYLLDNWGMTEASAQKCIEGKTFRHRALLPDGHPVLEEIRAEARLKSKRNAPLRKLRPIILERDGGRCQSCGKRVSGRDAALDHKDPEGETVEDNLILLCQSCNTIKSNRTWDEFQKANQEFWNRVKAKQDARPDFVCHQTGLSVKGRSLKEAGCLTPDLCLPAAACDNGGYAEFEREMDARLEAMYAAYDLESE